MPIYKLVTNFHGQPSGIVDVFLRCWMIKQYTTEIYTKTDGGKCISSLKYGYFWVPTCSMYGIFTYIYQKFSWNVGEYAIHGVNFGYLAVKCQWWDMFLQERLETLEALLKAAAVRNFRIAGNYKVGP